MNHLNAETPSLGHFELKRAFADLGARRSGAAVSLATLEAARLDGTRISASKHGLESICGASCETGAQ